MGHESWTIRALKEEVRQALSVGYVPASSARVRAVPDARTIRYYTTLGLLDRPASFKGRTAYYGRRHLLQLVAIKRLQAEGLSLSEIQHRLAGLDDEGLEAIASLPEPEAVEAASRREENFWEAVPVAVTAAAPAEAPAAQEAQEADALEVEPFVGVPLAAGLTLLVRTRRPLAGADLQAIRAASEPLLRALTGRGIVEV